VGVDLDNNQWRSVFRQLVARGYFSVDLEGFGSLRLEPKCRPLLRGEERIDLRKEIKQKIAKKQTRTPLPEDIDIGLWEALRDCRRRLAEDQGVPPYVIFHDSTLREMCVVRPMSLEQFGELTGVGERKREKYGKVFIDLIRSHQ
jgi:ATP-dependent DNA helicase RecQ